MNYEEHFKSKIMDVYIDLCKKFRDICQTQPNKSPKEIPGAAEIIQDFQDYEKFVKKYFGLVYDPDTHTWEEEAYIE